MEATQESTQPCTDPRRWGLNNSGLYEEDLSDVICILHPNSPAAHEAVAATASAAPSHILQKDVLEHGGGTAALDIALRLSSKVKDPKLGFCFGRTIARCDILLAGDTTSRRISNTHFRIYFTDELILMLEDVSTNGTIVDSCRLRKRDKENSRMLINGSVIQVISGDDASDEVKFVVRLPSREGHSEAYGHNLNRFVEKARRPGNAPPPTRQVPVHGLQWANTYGMHWSGSPTYNVTGQIGKGAFAVVYKLATKQHGAVFAAKELDKRRFTKNGILDQKVDNEMKIMKDLQHPNIVQYIDYHDYDRWIYIIMEYVPYGELSTYLANGKIHEDLVKTIARQILHALHYLHRRKITHRDIKPDNILIASHEPLRVKLSDFGLSKATQDETFLKTFCGTLLYCAPEVYPEYEMYRRGEVRKRRRLGDPPPKNSPYDQSVDMWSLGAVLYHILAGIPPYTGRGDDRGQQMLRTIMTTEPDYNVLHAAGVSEEGIDLVSQLLNRDPQLRPKERDCLKHPWLVDVPDVDEYDDDDVMSHHSEGLSDIGEVAEDELDASQLSLDELEDLEGELVEHDSGDLAQSKRPRIGSPPADIHYPSLPNIELSRDLQQISQATPRRLFGEITSSALRSSHALGDNPDAFEDSDFSLHDFVSSTGESRFSEGDSLNSVISLPENPISGSARSLLGAEKLVRQLNMNSWNPGTSNNPFPSAETASPRPSEGVAADDDQILEPRQTRTHATPKASKFSRRIELPIPDTASERSNSDDSTARYIGGQRGDSTTAPGEIFDIELANTLDAITGQSIPDGAEIMGFQPPADPSESGGPVGIPRPIHPRGQPRPLLGKLTTQPGSIIDLTLCLEDRMTSWGRGARATVCHPDPMDARIPAYALEVTFWARTIEDRVASGQDWMTMPGLMAILSTKTRGRIWVNDIELRKGPDGGLHFGMLYTGDVITVFQHRNKFLKFNCEFYHGESKQERPKGEKRFAVRKVFLSNEAASNKQPVRRRADGKE
ncbi:kinase-like domain-containing protein [Aspergillus californicus]